MKLNYGFWISILTVLLVVSNVVAEKIVVFWGFKVPSAVLTYAFVYLCTDIINERWGKKMADRGVKYGFVAQVVASVFFFMALRLPVAGFSTEVQEAMAVVLGQNWRFVVASLSAYIVSQRFDVFIFHKIKQWSGGRWKWLRNNGSTMVSQFLDSVIFIVIAFVGNVPNLAVMIGSQYVVKVVIAFLETPLFYLFTIRQDNG